MSGVSTPLWAYKKLRTYITVLGFLFLGLAPEPGLASLARNSLIGINSCTLIPVRTGNYELLLAQNLCSRFELQLR